MCNFGRGHHEDQSGSAEKIIRGPHKENFCEINLNLNQWFNRCRLKDFLSGALLLSCSAEWNQLRNFVRGHNGKQSCEIILNSD